MIPHLKDLIPSFRDRFSLAALFAILIYEIIRAVTPDREPTLSSVILIVAVGIIFAIMLWLVDPSEKPKELPRLSGRSVSFVGTFQTSQEVHKKIAGLLGAQVEPLSKVTEFIILGNNTGPTQDKLLEERDVRKVNEKEWLTWIDKEVARRLWIRRKYLEYKISKLREPKAKQTTKNQTTVAGK